MYFQILPVHVMWMQSKTDILCNVCYFHETSLSRFLTSGSRGEDSPVFRILALYFLAHQIQYVSLVRFKCITSTVLQYMLYHVHSLQYKLTFSPGAGSWCGGVTPAWMRPLFETTSTKSFFATIGRFF